MKQSETGTSETGCNRVKEESFSNERLFLFGKGGGGAKKEGTGRRGEKMGKGGRDGKWEREDVESGEKKESGEKGEEEKEKAARDRRNSPKIEPITGLFGAG